MLTYIIIIVAIIAAICFIPLLRTILRWILFLPISLLAGILIPYIDIPNLILSWIVSQISSFLGSLFDMHVFSMITIGERDATSSIEPIIWWHVLVLAVAAILGAWAAKNIDVDRD